MKLTNSTFIPSSCFTLAAHKTSKIIASNGIVQAGFFLPGTPPIATYRATCISLGPNSRVIINGNLFLGKGVSIRVEEGAEIIFEGDNFIGHNSFIFCKYKINIGYKTGISWNCTLMDNDGHTFYKNEVPLRNIKKPLIIEDYVGIQMNVIIPKGITIGSGSVIGAGSILRQDIAPNSLVYTKQELVIKDGYNTGFANL